jgi:hypothetical protein
MPGHDELGARKTTAMKLVPGTENPDADDGSARPVDVTADVDREAIPVGDAPVFTLANRTIIEAFTARAFALRTPEP